MRGHFAYLLSFIEVRMSNIGNGYLISLSQRFLVDRDIFEKAPRVDTDLFFHGQKKMRFQRYPDTCGRGLILLAKHNG